MHHAHLTEHISRLRSRHAADGHAIGRGDLQRGAVVLEQMISHQASQIGFNEIFHLLGMIFLCVIVFVWLAKPPFAAKLGGAPPAAATDHASRRSAIPVSSPVRCRRALPARYAAPSAGATRPATAAPAARRCRQAATMTAGLAPRKRQAGHVQGQLDPTVGDAGDRTASRSLRARPCPVADARPPSHSQYTGRQPASTNDVQDRALATIARHAHRAPAAAAPALPDEGPDDGDRDQHADRGARQR